MADIQETIEKLRELERVASPAPWVPRTGYTAGGLVSLDISAAMQASPVLMRVWADLTQSGREAEPQNDFTLIIEARNSLPVLLAEIDRLTTCLDISEARLGRVAANHPEAYLAALEGDEE